MYDVFKVVATVFQQIMTELCGALSEEDRIVAITKIVLTLSRCCVIFRNIISTLLEIQTYMNTTLEGKMTSIY
jgi:hypothetical protein